MIFLDGIIMFALPSKEIPLIVLGTCNTVADAALPAPVMYPLGFDAE